MEGGSSLLLFREGGIFADVSLNFLDLLFPGVPSAVIPVRILDEIGMHGRFRQVTILRRQIQAELKFGLVLVVTDRGIPAFVVQFLPDRQIPQGFLSDSVVVSDSRAGIGRRIIGCKILSAGGIIRSAACLQFLPVCLYGAVDLRIDPAFHDSVGRHSFREADVRRLTGLEEKHIIVGNSADPGILHILYRLVRILIADVIHVLRRTVSDGILQIVFLRLFNSFLICLSVQDLIREFRQYGLLIVDP